MKEQWMRTEEVARESEPRMEMNIATLELATMTRKILAAGDTLRRKTGGAVRLKLTMLVTWMGDREGEHGEGVSQRGAGEDAGAAVQWKSRRRRS